MDGAVHKLSFFAQKGHNAMSPLLVGIICTIFMFLLFAIGIRIGYAMAISGFIGFSYIVTLDAGLSILASIPYLTSASYTLSVIPLFVFMGQMAFHTGLSGSLYEAAHTWIGHLRGGLAMASIGACAAFGAITGSTTATVATIGSVAIPEMKKHSYQPELSTASIAAGGSLSLLIPPSLGFIVYGAITGQSVGKLFISGIFPGILLAFLFVGATYVVALRNPNLTPAGKKATLSERLAAMRGAGVVAILFLAMMGGIYAGVFTPTEAAGVGAFLVFLYALLKRRLTWKIFVTSLVETISITGMIFIILIGAMIFGRFMTVTKAPIELARLVGELGLSPYVVLLFVSLFFLIFGCIMDALALVLITVPIILPTIEIVGFDPTWFGVVVIILGSMGIITPPVGINIFVISGVAKVPVETAFRGIWPFLIAMVICLITITLFPQIALFLPTFMRG